MTAVCGSTEQVIIGREGNLVLGADGMAFVDRRGGPATERPSARYGDVKAVRCKGPRLTVEFSPPGPSWELTLATAEEAAWAAEFIRMHREAAETQRAVAEGLTVADLGGRLAELLEPADARVPAAATVLICGAAALGASDVHLTPGRKPTASLRVDGVLRRVCELPRETYPALVGRLKAMAGLPGYVADEPVGGPLVIEGATRVEARLTAVPAAGGEAVEVRILAPSTGPLDIAHLGLEAEQMARLKEALDWGMTVFTGPAGAGKTTTMYALMRWALDDARRRVVSVERPPERIVDGAVQMDVERLGRSWDAAVLAALRMDPEVIAVGEMHDRATAQAAVQAALAGHSLLTTLHAGATAEVPVRMLQLGVEPYALASALRLVVGQRLVRLVCRRCAEEAEARPETLAALGLEPADVAGWQLRAAGGCDACGQTGYAGRTGCFELWLLDEAARELILRRADVGEFARLQRDLGVATARDVALARAAKGETTLEEVLRVFGGMRRA